MNDRLLINHQVLRQSVPDPDQAKALLIRFKPMLAEELQALQQALTRRDLSAFRHHCHRLRSGSRYLGIDSIGTPATELEQLLETGDPDLAITATWIALQDACRCYLEQNDHHFVELVDSTNRD